MYGEISDTGGDLASEVFETESDSCYQTSRFNSGTVTEFKSITSVEPMEEYPISVGPLKLSCEEHDKTEASDPSITFGPISEPPLYEHKKARFVSPTRVLKESSPDVPSPTKAEPEQFIDEEIEEYENVSSGKSADATEDLAMKVGEVFFRRGLKTTICESIGLSCDAWVRW